MVELVSARESQIQIRFIRQSAFKRSITNLQQSLPVFLALRLLSMQMDIEVLSAAKTWLAHDWFIALSI